MKRTVKEVNEVPGGMDFLGISEKYSMCEGTDYIMKELLMDQVKT